MDIAEQVSEYPFRPGYIGSTVVVCGSQRHRLWLRNDGRWLKTDHYASLPRDPTGCAELAMNELANRPGTSRIGCEAFLLKWRDDCRSMIRVDPTYKDKRVRIFLKLAQATRDNRRSQAKEPGPCETPALQRKDKLFAIAQRHFAHHVASLMSKFTGTIYGTDAQHTVKLPVLNMPIEETGLTLSYLYWRDIVSVLPDEVITSKGNLTVHVERMRPWRGMERLCLTQVPIVRPLYGKDRLEPPCISVRYALLYPSGAVWGQGDTPKPQDHAWELKEAKV